MFESIFITILGGIVGIILGTILIYFASKLALRAGYVVELGISSYAVFLGIGFSVLTGVGFGLYPAKKASQLTPMDALRKE